MRRRTQWLALAVISIVLAGMGIVWAVQDGQAGRTVDDLYALLVNEDGESRLQLVEAELRHISEKVDLIESVARKMLEEQYGFFDEQFWSFDDIKISLDNIEDKVDDIKEVTDCQGCP